jgi:hypothetical protein
MSTASSSARHGAGGLVLAACLVAGAAAAAERCIPLVAQTTSERVTSDCASPVGLCTAGTVSGPWLNGEQRYTASLLAPAPGGASALLYAGTIEITTAAGGLSISDFGVFDPATGAIAEVGVISGGSGAFQGATGRTYLVGQSNAGGGFDGRLSGTVCFER